MQRKLIWMAGGVICGGLVSGAQSSFPAIQNHSFYSFGAWKDLPDKNSKAFFYEGFLNGFLAGARPAVYETLGTCIDKHLSTDQALAMIDKYSTENPQRWNVPIPIGIAEALTVKDGPCPGLNPYK